MLLVVQRGHCYRTTGATGAPGEQRFATDAADRVAVHARALGYRVRIINADVAQELYAGDLFVAVHYDSSTNPAARGASVGYQGGAGATFARAWKRHYALNGWTGGFRPDNYTTALAGYYGVRRARLAGNERAIIVEAGFGSNAADRTLLAGPAGPDRVGRSIAAALVDLFGCRCPPGAAPAPATRLQRYGRVGSTYPLRTVAARYASSPHPDAVETMLRTIVELNPTLRGRTSLPGGFPLRIPA